MNRFNCIVANFCFVCLFFVFVAIPVPVTLFLLLGSIWTAVGK